MMKRRFGGILFTILTLWAGSLQAKLCGDSEECVEYLVQFSDQTASQEIASLLDDHNLFVVEYFKSTNIYHIAGENSLPQGEVLRNLNADPRVIYAEPNYQIRAQSLPNDPLFPELWALHNTGQNQGTAGIDIGMEEVWNRLDNTEPIVVAVIDSGIDYTHEDLAANMWRNPGEIPNNNRDDDNNGYVDDVYGYNFYDDESDPMDDYYHGTHMAGTIGAVGDNGIGVTGVARDVRLMALKFMGSRGDGPLSDAIRAIDYAVQNGAKIISSSWDFTYPGLTNLPVNASTEPVQSLRSAIRRADQAGVIFVAAAGNNGNNNDALPHYPSAYTLGNILSVAATDTQDHLPNFSNYGATTVDLGAPGSVIYSTYPTWKASPAYHVLSGTSNAVPHVAGAAAVLWSQNPQLTHRQVIDWLFEGVKPLPELQGKTVTGGRLNLAESLALASPEVNHPPVANAGATQYKRIGDSIILRGTATDADGDAPLYFSWTLTLPSGSGARLNPSSGSQVVFTADVAGTYTARLTVSDGQSSSSPSTVLIQVTQTPAAPPPPSAVPSQPNNPSVPETKEILPPSVIIEAREEKTEKVLDPTRGGEVEIGQMVLIDGTESSPVTQTTKYQWVFVEKPAGSECLLEDADQPLASFVPDIEGRYTIQLTVSEGKISSQGERAFVAREDASQNVASDPTSAHSTSGGCALIR